MSAGVAIRMAQALRLGREYHQRHVPLEREIRRRVMWTCFMIDNLVSFVTSRPRTIQHKAMSIQLPCPPASFLFGEDYSMPTLGNLTPEKLQTEDLMPFFVQTLQLWGGVTEEVAEWVIGRGNGSISSTANDDRRDADIVSHLKTWVSQLPTRLRWSISGYRAFRLLGGDDLYTLMHLLLHHALCLAGQRFLPHGDDVMIVADHAASRPLVEEDEISACRAQAFGIVDIAEALFADGERGMAILSTPFAGLALTGSASVLIWLANAMPMLRSSRPDSGSSILGEVSEANKKLERVTTILRACTRQLRLPSSWLETISFLQDFYAVAYTGNYNDEENSGAVPGNHLSSETTGEISGGSGVPDSDAVTSAWPLSRQVMMLTSGTLESSATRTQLAQAQIRSLWNRVWLQAQITTPQDWLNSIWGLVDSQCLDDGVGAILDSLEA